MKNNPGSTRESKRWQDIRARAIDATFDADRRRVGERVAIVSDGCFWSCSGS